MEEQNVPKIVFELMDKAEEALNRKNYDYAVELLTQAVETKPDYVEPRKKLRETEFIEFEQRTTPGFMHAIKSAIINVAPMISAAIKLSSKKYVEAMEVCEKILRRDPRNVSVLIQLSKAAEGADYIDVAIICMEYARKVKPQSVTILKRLGYLYKDNEQLDEAKVCFQSIVARDPGDREAEKELNDLAALGTIMKGGWEDTTSYRDKIKDVDFSQTTEKETRLVRSAEDTELLEESYKKQLEQQPENIDHYRKLADLYIGKKQFEKAVEVFDRAIGQFPQNPDLPEMRFRTRGLQHNERIKEIEEKLEQQPDNPELSRQLEDRRREKLQFEIEHLKERIEKYPNDLTLRYEYGLALFGSDDIDEAVKQLQSAVKSPKHRSDSLNYLGQCFFRKGLFDMAVNQFKKALAEVGVMDSFKKEVLYNLGRVYEEQGKQQEALEQYQIIYEEDIGYRDVSERVERLYQSRKKPE